MKVITIEAKTKKAFSIIQDIIETESIWSNDEKLRVHLECPDYGLSLRFFAHPRKVYKYLNPWMTQDAIDELVTVREKRGATGAVWLDWNTGKPQIYVEYKM